MMKKLLGNNRMTLIYNDGILCIYVDNETGCQYITKGTTGIFPMIDKDGKPLIYEKR
jgi:hypothetical protein